MNTTITIPSSVHTAIVEKILAQKGQIRTVTQRKTLKTRKGVTDTVEKKSRYQVRFGCQYENRQAVKEIRETGKEAQPLEEKGYRYVNFPYIAEHLNTGKLYAAATPVDSKLRETAYFLNGKEVEKSVIEPLVLKSEIAVREEIPLWYFIRLETLESVV